MGYSYLGYIDRAGIIKNYCRIRQKNTAFAVFLEKSWLWTVCGFRAELIEIGWDIDEVKDKLEVADLG